MIIYKPNFAIIENNNLSNLQRKLFNQLIFEFSKIKFTSNIINLSRQELGDFIPSNFSHAQIKKIFLGLMKNEMFSLENNLNEDYEFSCYISAVKATRNNYQIEMSSQLINFLNINYKNSAGKKNIEHGYTELDLNKLNVLQGIHSLPMYELIKSKTFKFKNFNLSFKFIYDFLAKDKKSYAEFKHFNNMLLKPAIAEINDVTDLKIIYEPIKKGGRVNIINFSVQTPQK